MCEGVDKCPSTGKSIEDAPCRAILTIMESCKAGIHQKTQSLPPVVRDIGIQDGGMGIGLFLEENGWNK